MGIYRVFVERHYIDVVWFDVESDSKRHAESDAQKTATLLIPDSRSRAVDNHWHSDTALEIPYVGSAQGTTPETTPNFELAFETKRSKMFMNKYDFEKI
jgi:hypothetical protein